MNALKEIFAVKTLREARALGAVRQQDRVLAQAIAQRDAARVSLQEFSQYAQHRETELFHGLLQHPTRSVRLRDIQEVQVEVSVLRTQEGEFKTALVKAEDRQNQEAQKLVTVKATHAKAYRDQQKFVELLRIQSADEAFRLERNEEGEAETPARPQGPLLEVYCTTGALGG